MKSIYSLISALLIFCFIPLNSGATNDFTLLLGGRNDSGDTPMAGFSLSPSSNYQLGAMGFFELNNTLNIRGGLLYTRRGYSLKEVATGNIWTFGFSSFDLPLGVLLKVSDYGGVFAGALLSMNLSKECSGASSCTVQNVNSGMFGYQVGVSFKFAPQLGGEFYFEYLPGSLFSHIENIKGVGLNLLIYFE